MLQFHGDGSLYFFDVSGYLAKVVDRVVLDCRHRNEAFELLRTIALKELEKSILPSIIYYVINEESDPTEEDADSSLEGVVWSEKAFPTAYDLLKQILYTKVVDNWKSTVIHTRISNFLIDRMPKGARRRQWIEMALLDYSEKERGHELPTK